MSVMLLVAVPVLGMLAAVRLVVMVVVALCRAWRDTAPDPAPAARYALSEVAHLGEARSRREARNGLGGVR
jgi:hypothetical protein